MCALGIGTTSSLCLLNAQPEARHDKVAMKQRLRRSHHPLVIQVHYFASFSAFRAAVSGSDGKQWKKR